MEKPGTASPSRPDECDIAPVPFTLRFSGSSQYSFDLSGQEKRTWGLVQRREWNPDDSWLRGILKRSQPWNSPEETGNFNK